MQENNVDRSGDQIALWFVPRSRSQLVRPQSNPDCNVWDMRCLEKFHIEESQ